MSIRSLLLFLPMLAIASSVGAVESDVKTPIPAPEHRTLDEFGVANPACHEWSDGCAVCLRKDDGSAGCSLPGIACEPAATACKQAIDPKKQTDPQPSPAPH